MTKKCFACGEECENSNLCQKCENKGYWIDPAGGLHCEDEDDPAAMYK